MTTVSLPSGRLGRLLALGITLLAAVLLWLGLAAPLIHWYAERAELLQGQQLIANRMAALVSRIPALRQQVAAQGAGGGPDGSLLEGATDALAGAALQGRIEEMARSTGAQINSIETLPAEPAGRERRIALRVSVAAAWPAMIALLQAIEQATPAMVVDEMQMRGPPMREQPGAPMIEAVLTVAALRAGEAVQSGGRQQAAVP